VNTEEAALTHFGSGSLPSVFIW